MYHLTIVLDTWQNTISLRDFLCFFSFYSYQYFMSTRDGVGRVLRVESVLRAVRVLGVVSVLSLLRVLSLLSVVMYSLS